MVGAPKAPVTGTAEDGRGVAVAGIPEALVAGTTEGPRPESPEVLVAETAEEQSAATETHEVVDMGIPDRPTS